MDSEAVSNASFLQLAEEDDILADFLDGYMEIPDPRINVLKVVEFMIMGGEKRLGAMSVFMDVFDDGAGNRHSVVCGCPASDFIKKHEGA